MKILILGFTIIGFSLGYFFYSFNKSVALPKTSPQERLEFNETYSSLEYSEEEIMFAKLEFKKNCKVCHGPNGEGRVGPNLTDSYWISGDGSPISNFTILKNGLIKKGMPAWTKFYSIQEMAILIKYMSNFKLIDLPNGKKPEGKLFK